MCNYIIIIISSSSVSYRQSQDPENECSSPQGGVSVSANLRTASPTTTRAFAGSHASCKHAGATLDMKTTVGLERYTLWTRHGSN